MIKNLFREIALQHVIGYAELSTNKKDLFDKSYINHLNGMSIKKRQSYTEHHLMEVKRYKDGFVAIFDNGELYNYPDNGEYHAVG